MMNIVEIDDDWNSIITIAYSKKEGPLKNNEIVKEKNRELTLKFAAKQIGLNLQDSKYEIIKGEGGKIKDKEGKIIASASISYSDNFCFVAIAQKEYSIGIDVENADRIIEKEIYNYILNNFEIKGKNRPNDFITTWNIVEAVTKCLGHGLQNTKNIEFIEKNLCKFKGARFSVKNYEKQISSQKFKIAIAKKC